jgi:hypothetical protein
MRAILVSAGFALVALAVVPTVGASCHWCVATDPLNELIHHFLP